MNQRGTGGVEIAGTLIYALFVRFAWGLRLRLSADDWERLGLPVGARVEVCCPSGLRDWYFVQSATFVEPCWQWVECSRAPVRARRPVPSQQWGNSPLVRPFPLARNSLT